jgi:hypothetical protein
VDLWRRLGGRSPLTSRVTFDKRRHRALLQPWTPPRAAPTHGGGSAAHLTVISRPRLPVTLDMCRGRDTYGRGTFSSEEELSVPLAEDGRSRIACMGGYLVGRRKHLPALRRS